MGAVSVFHRHSDDVVISKDLDGALRTACAVSDKEHRVAALPRPSNVGDPVADPATEFHRRLTRDLVHAGFVFERELLETHTHRCAAFDLGPLRKGLLDRQGGHVASGRGVS